MLNPFTAYALTRLTERFAGRALLFGPGQPLAPVASDPAPRQWQYPSSINLLTQPRRDLPGLAAFDLLRFLAKRHPLAALCIRVRAEQIAALDWQVVARDKGGQASEQATCAALQTWWQYPDRVTPRVAWLKAFVRDLLEIDAPTLYAAPSRGGGLHGLDLIDGATIKPILDARGRIVSYQQVLYGLALSQYRGSRVPITEEEVIGEYAVGELLYQPYTPQVASPYGRTPMEDMLDLAQTTLKKIEFDLGHFTDGNIPGALAVLDSEGTIDPDQLSAFEEHFNMVLQGDTTRGHKIKFIPFPMRIERLQTLSEGGRYESAFEERMVKVVAALYGLTPAELGFTEDVNRATGDSQQNVQQRVGIRPMVRWLKEVIFDPVIQHHLGQPQCEMMALDLEESEDAARTAAAHQADIASGVLTAQESRAMRYPDLPGQAPSIPATPSVSPTPLTKRAELPPDADARAALSRQLHHVIRQVLGEQAARIVTILRQAGDADAMRAALAAVWPTEHTTLLQAVLPVFDAALDASLQTGVQVVPGGVASPNPAVLTLARDHAARWATSTVQTTDGLISQAIADWVATGGTLPDLLSRVQAISDRWVDRRSTTGAVTEITRLYAEGNRAAWRASSVVTGYTVRNAEDRHVCPVCDAHEGQTHPLSSDVGMPPFHAMCRCWIVPVVAP